MFIGGYLPSSPESARRRSVRTGSARCDRQLLHFFPNLNSKSLLKTLPKFLYLHVHWRPFTVVSRVCAEAVGQDRHYGTPTYTPTYLLHIESNPSNTTVTCLTPQPPAHPCNGNLPHTPSTPATA